MAAHLKFLCGTFVFSDYHKKIPQTGWFMQPIFILTILEVSRSKIKVPANLFFDENSLPDWKTASSLLPVSSHGLPSLCAEVGRGGGALSIRPPVLLD